MSFFSLSLVFNSIVSMKLCAWISIEITLNIHFFSPSFIILRVHIVEDVTFIANSFMQTNNLKIKIVKESLNESHSKNLIWLFHLPEWCGIVAGGEVRCIIEWCGKYLIIIIIRANWNKQASSFHIAFGITINARSHARITYVCMRTRVCDCDA